MRVNSALIAIFLISSSFTVRPDRDVWAKQVNLMVRQMGHQLLLQAGDSTSRVLPVTEIKEGTFQLTFENEFFFNHDSLMMLSRDVLPKAQFPSGYILTVHENTKTDIVYGFQVSNTSPDLAACLGRIQPPGRYRIEVDFPDLYKKSESNQNLFLSGALLLLGVTLLVGRLGKILKPKPAKNLGKFVFDVKGQRLLLENEVISLTEKECKILELLNKDFGKLIHRETLMQKIWIDEGVITSRSLDVFVSKLRKKLSLDPGLRITNVHGKGYKLEMNIS
jgi:hypothetical protein